ncbi:putative non-specific serine/threonine protein kinase [Helianthus annuus]|nr:putative non-specific serine/threonine protein kinase [Helianthus annuus]
MYHPSFSLTIQKMQKHDFQFQFQTTIIFIFSLLLPTLSLDTITPTTPITLNQTLVSNQQVFELGFFRLDNNNNWYIGIWYKQIEPKTYVWVANRDNPVNSSSGKLTIGGNGNIILLSEAGTAVWTSNDSNYSVRAVNTVAQLLDSGNFVLRPEGDERPESYIWESFKNPTDTLLPGMRLGWDRKTGVNRFLRSWKSGMDPGSGSYAFKMNVDGFPEIFLSAGVKPVYRSGPWNGKRFSGVPEMKGVSVIKFEFENNYNEVFYSYEMANKSDYSRLIMTSSGTLRRFTWIESSKTWNPYWFAPRDQCDEYRKCGPWGVCDANASPLCKCMKGFRPKNQQAWDLRDGSDGCVRSSEMDCGSDGFRLMKNMKLPEGSKAFVDQTLSLSECGEICKRNCSCVAYANTNISENGSGCVIWAVDLLDMRQYADTEGGQDLFVRAAASDSGTYITFFYTFF